MDATGCVPTTLAMVISGITGTEVLPTTVADYLYNHTNEFNKDGFGTSSRGIVRAAQHWDLTTETLFTASAVKEVLSQGHHVLGAVGTSIFAHYPVTHELVLKGYDNGKTYVRDPYNAAGDASILGVITKTAIFALSLITVFSLAGLATLKKRDL